MPTVLQITDLHLRHERQPLIGVDTQASLEAVLHQALVNPATARQVDALLVTGDIAHDPQPEVYHTALEILRSYYAGPMLWLPGNHDVNSAMAPALRSGDLERNQLDLPAAEGESWRIITFDSHADDAPQAEFSAEARARLLQQIAAAGPRPLLLATHHPLIPVGCPWLDKDRIQKGHELIESCAKQGNVRAMAFGHIHQRLTARHISTHGDIMLWGTPSTCFQSVPGSQTFSVSEEHPGYRWLMLGNDGQITSTVEQVSDHMLSIQLDR